MILARQLLDVADQLLDGATRQTRGRRAVSTAYYAVFHAFAHLCAREILGESEGSESAEYQRVYRALDHGSLKKAFLSEPLSAIDTLKSLGALVVQLQSERARADYLPRGPVYSTSRQCRDLVQSARLTCDRLDGLSAQDKRTLAVHLIFKNRPQ